MSKPSTDVIRRVFLDDEFRFVEVGPWSEDVELVELRTVKGEYSEGHFGSLSIAMSPEAAEELGRALIASASDIRGSK
jgi:hypothetical protein